jgi:hypothetical protein
MMCCEVPLSIPNDQRRYPMLMRVGNDRPFPQNDLAYLAFRLTACQMLYRISLATEASPDDTLPEGTPGFLERVRVLSGVPVTIQVDLLASVWARHNATRPYQATLLDAAVLFAACQEGAVVIQEVPTAVRLVYLRDSPRQLDIRLDAWTVNRLAKLYSRWWPGFDPRQGSALIGLEDYPPRLSRPLREAGERTELSPGLHRRFAGLLTSAEMREFFPFLY